MVRFVTVTKVVKTTFMKMKKIKDGKAVTIFGTIREVFEEFGVEFKKVVGLGTDGASVMASDMNGVTGLIHQVTSHCVCVYIVYVIVSISR